MASTLTSSGARRRLYPTISCITVSADASEYDFKTASYFDVPDEDYVSGNLTGTKIVLELINAAVQDECFDWLTAVVTDATKEMERGDADPEAPSKHGAAVGFLGTLQDVFIMAASSLDFKPIFKTTFNYHERELEERLSALRVSNAQMISSLSNLTQGATA